MFDPPNPYDRRPRPAARPRKFRARIRNGLATVVLACVPMAGSARVDVDTFAVEVVWRASTGDVDRYAVFVSRNGAAFTGDPEVVVASNYRYARIPGTIGERLTIRIAAIDFNGRYGPVSEPSDEILFTGNGPLPPPPTPPPPPPRRDSNCAREVPVAMLGEKKLRVPSEYRAVAPALRSLKLCKDRFRLEDGAGAVWTGVLRRKKARTWRLELDAASQSALLAASAAEIAAGRSFPLGIGLVRAPKAVLKRNRAKTRLRLDFETKLRPIGKDIDDGLYRLKLKGKVPSSPLKLP